MELEKAREVIDALIEMKVGNMSAARAANGGRSDFDDKDDCDIEVTQALQAGRDALNDKIADQAKIGPSEKRPKRRRLSEFRRKK